VSEQNVFSSIEQVLQRIDEIKKRFGVNQKVYYPLISEKVNRQGFQEKLKKVQENEDKEGGKSNISSRSEELDKVLKTASEKYSIPVQLIKAVIQQESGFNSQAVSSRGAMGLMQLMPQTAELLGVENPFDISENVLGGTRYLRELLNLYQGNLNRALAAYNAGPHKVGEDIPEILETRNFIKSVLDLYESYSNTGEENVSGEGL